MAVFVEPWKNKSLDWRLFLNGATTLYWRMEYLEDDVKELQRLHYDTVELDASAWKTEEQFFTDVQRGLRLPQYCGMNCNGFNDCMSDIQSENSGTVLALKHYDRFASRLKEFSFAILDILEDRSRYLLLTGQRLLVLVQVDDPTCIFPPLGGRNATWNRREWHNRDREIPKPNK